MPQMILKFLEIFLLIVLCVMAVLVATKETKDENKNLTKWGKISIGGIITTCILQVAVYFIKENVDDIEKENQKANYQKSLNRLNNIINKSNITLQKQDFLQNSSKSILQKVEENLDLQTEVFDGQKNIFKNTERSLSPISNLKFRFTLEYPFENPIVKNIISDALVIKKKFENEHNLITQNPYTAVIDGYLFNFDSTHVISFNSSNDDLIRKYSFRFPSMSTYFSTHKKAKPNLTMWSREGTSTYIVQYFSVNFDKKILTIEFEPTQLEILGDGGKFVGFKDFVKSVFMVDVHYFYNTNEIMQNLSLKRTWIINGGKKYIIEFNEKERSLSKNSLPNTYIHVLKEKEFIH